MLKGYTAGLDAGPKDDAGPIQNMCGAGSVPGPDFGENSTSLVPTCKNAVASIDLICLFCRSLAIHEFLSFGDETSTKLLK